MSKVIYVAGDGTGRCGGARIGDFTVAAYGFTRLRRTRVLSAILEYNNIELITENSINQQV